MRDEEIVRNCVLGQPEAWEVFAKEYSDLIRQTVVATLRLFGVREDQEELVRDLFQEFFLALKEDGCRRLRRFQGTNSCSLSSWLKVVASRFVIDHLRRQNPALVPIDHVNADDRLFLESCLADEPCRPDRKAENNSDLAFLCRELKRLPAKDQLIMKLVYEDGLSVQEVSELVRMREGAVYTRISRIRDKLRSKVGRQRLPE